MQPLCTLVVLHTATSTPLAGTYPLKSSKRDKGLSDVPVNVAGVTVHPGDWVYADKDGVLVSKEELKL
jgi:regulator of ribonuclease activity A